MALLSISVVPLGTKKPSIGDYIADVIRVCQKSRVEYRLTDMGTIIEGPAKDLFSIANRLHETPFKKGIKRVVTDIRVDDRRDKRVRLGDKVSSVLARL